MSFVRWFGTLAMAGAACGGEVNPRAFELEIRGLSARADALVLKVRGPERPTVCRDVDLATAPTLDADEERRWDRASMVDRSFELPELEADAITLVAYALDPAGAPIQLACQQLTYEALGNLAGGRVVLTLSQRQ